MATAAAAVAMTPERSRALLQTAWWAVVLGCGLEAAMLLAAALFQQLDRPHPFVADLAQKVSWGVLVCIALAFGNTAAKVVRVPLSGILGLVGAPFAFVVSRAVHKGLAQGLDLALAVRGGPSPLLVAALKGIEYGLLGVALAWLAERRSPTAKHFAAVGLTLGLVFGSLLLWLSGKLGAGAYVALTGLINEVLFPVGCSLVLYASTALGRQLAR